MLQLAEPATTRVLQGKIASNLMIDMTPTNEKLKEVATPPVAVGESSVISPAPPLHHY